MTRSTYRRITTMIVSALLASGALLSTGCDITDTAGLSADQAKVQVRAAWPLFW